LGMRTPFVALRDVERTRAELLQQSLLRMLHMQFLKRQLEIIAGPLIASPVSAQLQHRLANTMPLQSLLLQADFITSSLLVDAGALQHPSAWMLLLSLRAVYRTCAALCPEQSAWFTAAVPAEAPPDSVSA